jgi:hypothetical protein
MRPIQFEKIGILQPFVSYDVRGMFLPSPLIRIWGHLSKQHDLLLIRRLADKNLFLANIYVCANSTCLKAVS